MMRGQTPQIFFLEPPLVTLGSLVLPAWYISCNKYVTEPSARSLTLHEYNIEILAEEAEYNLFHNSCYENHCLRHIYTVNEKPGAMRLRTRGHDFMLPFVKYNFNKNFIVRALYNYI